MALGDLFSTGTPSRQEERPPTLPQQRRDEFLTGVYPGIQQMLADRAGTVGGAPVEGFQAATPEQRAAAQALYPTFDVPTTASAALEAFGAPLRQDWERSMEQFGAQTRALGAGRTGQAVGEAEDQYRKLVAQPAATAYFQNLPNLLEQQRQQAAAQQKLLDPRTAEITGILQSIIGARPAERDITNIQGTGPGVIPSAIAGGLGAGIGKAVGTAGAGWLGSLINPKTATTGVKGGTAVASAPAAAAAAAGAPSALGASFAPGTAGAAELTNLGLGLQTQAGVGTTAGMALGAALGTGVAALLAVPAIMAMTGGSGLFSPKATAKKGFGTTPEEATYLGAHQAIGNQSGRTPSISRLAQNVFAKNPELQARYEAMKGGNLGGQKNMMDTGFELYDAIIAEAGVERTGDHHEDMQVAAWETANPTERIQMFGDPNEGDNRQWSTFQATLAKRRLNAMPLEERNRYSAEQQQLADESYGEGD